MDIKDLIVSPIYFLLFSLVAYVLRPYFTNRKTTKFFLPALGMKFLGTISLGLIYHYYYGGGDTFGYHTHGSRWIWEAFMNDPIKGLKLLLESGGVRQADTFLYSSHIWYYKDPSSYLVVRLAAIFDFFTFHTYTATAMFFAVFSFSGSWALFTILQRFFPRKTSSLALSCLFVPSVIFFGSGLLKDSVTFSALCWSSYSLFSLYDLGRTSFKHILIIVAMCWVMFAIKIYILLCFLLSASLFFYQANMSKIKDRRLKIILAPILVVTILGMGYWTVNMVSQNNKKYALDKIGETARITAYDIRYGWGARGGDNSGYTLGELDGSFASLIRLAPEGIIVSLFRPWIWEVKNPLMLLSALESMYILFFTLSVLFTNSRKSIYKKIKHPIVLYCLFFSLVFAFAVGVSTYNFGTLMRYKIPALTFYFVALSLISSKDTAQTTWVKRSEKGLTR